MKNWERLVLDPALAMESIPAAPCLCLKFSSINLKDELEESEEKRLIYH